MKRYKMRKVRLEHYMSVEDISIKLNTTKNNIYLIEQGKRNGSYEFWKNFQNLFQIPSEDMWGIIKEGE